MKPRLLILALAFSFAFSSCGGSKHATRHNGIKKSSGGGCGCNTFK